MQIFAEKSANQQMEIVLIEDGLMDARMAISAIRRCSIHHRLTLLRDGQDALKFLRREGMYSRAPVPHVVLLDIFLPGVDGFEILAHMKEDGELSKVPVIVLTSSDEPSDRERANEACVQHFIVKPFNEDRFLQVLHELNEQSLLQDINYLPMQQSANT